jgi:hypothetical protein
MSRRCLATGCARKVDDRYLMCGIHWVGVPASIQKEVYASYVVGQTAATASDAWKIAAEKAVASLKNAG